MLDRSSVNSGSEVSGLLSPQFDLWPFRDHTVLQSLPGLPVYPKGFERWIVRIADLSLEDCASNLR